MKRWLVVVVWMMMSWVIPVGARAATLTGRTDGLGWLAATASEQAVFCDKAFLAFRSSSSQSYITSAHVQALSAEAFCQRLDQFYSYELNHEISLDEAAALAPLLFADLPLTDLKADIRHDRTHY